MADRITDGKEGGRKDIPESKNEKSSSSLFSPFRSMENHTITMFLKQHQKYIIPRVK